MPTITVVKTIEEKIDLREMFNLIVKAHHCLDYNVYILNDTDDTELDILVGLPCANTDWFDKVMDCFIEFRKRLVELHVSHYPITRTKTSAPFVLIGVHINDALV